MGASNPSAISFITADLSGHMAPVADTAYLILAIIVAATARHLSKAARHCIVISTRTTTTAAAAAIEVAIITAKLAMLATSTVS